MALTLQKQQSISLAKTAGSSLTSISLGLGWDPVKAGGFLGKMFGGGAEIDLDASCILLNSDYQKIDLVWFRQLKSQDGSIKHSGDNRTGEGDGDDETINVDLQRLPASVKYLIFTVNSFTGQTFEKVEKAYCRIVNGSNNNELARFNLSEKGGHTGIVMASLTRENGDWEFKAIGTTTNGRTADDLITLAVQALR
ncbi:tellurium resistance TerZ family protein [Pseudomonas sp. ChxA]|jgi:tellurium resistance protein TerZ|uniref:TerD family protein n=1 Tax=Pseudomonas TaxID=286 RepID=UPI000996D352|nr:MULTISPECIES: TerD family protein [Pseudomonas]MBF6042996.1 TerD family protein [Pseudomonas mucoides]MBJ2203707.1 tellurium resistance TerZ family protein [Pseudomonas carnis]MBX9407827.1 tellurium resistance TerZ family protein [Pseudomonas baetica]MDL2189362.1 tellurium resistance TerZ family protein [Pseudomonas sp. ChxA]NMX82536.1 TerD family protein [Pseudomonas sp. WS 5503]